MRQTKIDTLFEAQAREMTPNSRKEKTKTSNDFDFLPCLSDSVKVVSFTAVTQLRDEPSKLRKRHSENSERGCRKKNPREHNLNSYPQHINILGSAGDFPRRSEQFSSLGKKGGRSLPPPPPPLAKSARFVMCSHTYNTPSEQNRSVFSLPLCYKCNSTWADVTRGIRFRAIPSKWRDDLLSHYQNETQKQPVTDA